MAISNTPFFSNTIIEPVANITDVLSDTFLLPNDGLFGRKKQHILFTGLKSVDTIPGGKTNQEEKALSYPDVEVYIDPEKIKVSKKVIVNKVLTKGGWVNQFWGHEQPTIDMNCNSGYFGLSKGRTFAANQYLNLSARIGATKKSSIVKEFGKPAPYGAVDPLKIFEQIKTYVYDNRFDGDFQYKGTPIIKMIYEGVLYKGYFTRFDYSLSANRPFVIDYGFQFVVISPPEKYATLQRLQDSVSVSSAVNTLGQGINRGFSNTVSGITKTLSDSAISYTTNAVDTAVNELFKKIGTKNLIDNTPSKIILA